MAKTNWTMRLRMDRKGRTKQCRELVSLGRGRTMICGNIWEEVVIKGKRISKRRCLGHNNHVVGGKSKSPRRKVGKSKSRSLRHAA
jgi:hypothetical protein